MLVRIGQGAKLLLDKRRARCEALSRQGKEIKKKVGETVWEYYQILKDLLSKLSFKLPEVQHREWFLAGLLPHIHIILQ